MVKRMVPDALDYVVVARLGLGVRVRGLGFRFWGLGFRVLSLGFRV